MLVSIFTPTIDGSAAFIDEALRSVERPAGVDVEHIIVHDGSDAFVRDLTARYPYLRILRGPGKGATAAIRIGYASARGDFILELNSDDRLVPGAIARLVTCAEARPEVRIWTGGLRIFRTLSDHTEQTLRLAAARAETELTIENALDDLPLCNSRFFHRSVIAELGGIDANFPHSSDRALVLKAAIAKIPEASLDFIVAEMRVHEGSQTLHRRARYVPPYLAEHVRLADLWLADPDITAMFRRKLLRWRARESLRLAFYELRAGKPREALAGIGKANVRDPAWLPHTTSSLAAWLRRRRSGCWVS